jgi:uncharacterized protein (UPF0332 family)
MVSTKPFNEGVVLYERWQKHLDRAEEKLISAQILFDNQMHNDTISEAYYSMYHSTKAIFMG